MKHSMEALLRPPLELYPGICAILVASLALANPSYFLLSPFMAVSFATLLFIFGGVRTFQAYQVIRYRVVLNQIKNCEIKANQLPKNSKYIFLGKGFLWSTKHTQRMRDLKACTQFAHLQFWFHSVVNIPHRIIHLISRRLGNRFVHCADGNPTIHGVGAYDGECDICLDLGQSGNHILVFGKAGVGKTRLAETLIAQDIHRDDVVVVLDSKGDKRLRECVSLEADKAGRHCQIFDTVPPDISTSHSANPPDAFASRSTNPLDTSTPHSANPPDAFAPRSANQLDTSAPRSTNDVSDWSRAASNKQVIYLNLTAENTSQCVSAITTRIFSDLISLAEAMNSKTIVPGANGKDISITVHLDEAGGLIDAQFLTLLNKAGQTGLRLVVYAQTVSDLVLKLNSKWELSQIISYFPSVVMFQVSDMATTKLLTDQMPKVEVSSLVLVSGSSDDSNPETSVDFKSSTQARKVTRDMPLISATDIMQLPKGQCFCLMNGGQLYKLRTFLILPERKSNAANIFVQQTQGYQ